MIVNLFDLLIDLTDLLFSPSNTGLYSVKVMLKHLQRREKVHVAEKILY